MRILIGVTALLFILPRVGVQCIRAWFRQQNITRFDQELIGKGMRRFVLRRVLIANRPLSNFDQWFHYLAGDLDLVGPEAFDVKALHQLKARDRIRFKVAPGIVSPYTIKKMAGIAYQSEKEIAVEFVNNDSGFRRFGLVVVWWVQRLVGADKINLSAPDQFSLFGVTIANTSMHDAVSSIVGSLQVATDNDNKVEGKPASFGFVNADCANNYYHNQEYRHILNNFDGVFADGIGVKMAARSQGIALRDNVNGTDMLPILCDQLNSAKKRVFLLGASAAVVKKVAQKIEREYPQLTVAGYVDGFSCKNNPHDLCQHINSSGADLLMVAMGAPRQEQWIHDNINCLNVKAVIGVGGLFDFYSGAVSRAPEWLRELSLEWVWRLAVQPLDKGKRYLLGNPLFLMRVVASKLTQTQKTQTIGV